MSHPMSGGREGRHNLTSSKSGGSVTVKTLPNSQSSSYQNNSSKRLYAREKEIGSKPSKEASSVVTQHQNNNSRNGDNQSATKPKILAPKSRSSSGAGSSESSSEPVPTSGSVTTKALSVPFNSSAPNQRGAMLSTRTRNFERPSSLKGSERRPSTSEDREVEVRSGYSTGRGGRGISTRPLRNESRGGHFSSSNAYPTSSRGSSRVFTSEKYRNSNNHHVMENDMIEYFRQTIPDGVLCKLLSMVTREEASQTHHANAVQLQSYIADLKNIRSIQKSSSSLWDALLEIHTSHVKGNSVQHLIAVCLAKAGLISVESQSHYSTNNTRFFKWLIEKYEQAKDSTKVWLMTVLHEVLQGGTVHISAMAQYLMSELQTLLESAETGKVLVAVLKDVLYFAEHNPPIFSPVFLDVVDILVGWYLELGQTDDTISKTTDALISLHDYWIVNMHLCRTLTGQFLEDMENYTEEAQSLSSKEEKKLAGIFEKIVLLLRVFHTLVKASGEYFNSKRTENIEKGYIAKSLERILTCVNQLNTLSQTSILNRVVGDCISVLAACGEDLSAVGGVNEFVSSQVDLAVSSNNTDQASFLLTVNKLIQNSDITKLSKLTQHLLSMDLTSLKLSCDIAVQSRVIDLYRNLFAVKDMPTIQAVFKKTKECIERSLNVLSGDVEVEWTETRADLSHNKHRAEELLIFHLSCLSQVATDTNNLILMYSIEPSIFNFLLKDIILTCGDSLRNNPVALVHILRLLHLHCNSNKNFIAKSNLCAADTFRRHRHNITVNKSSGDNFSLILESMSEMFSLVQDNTKGLNLLSKWISEIIEQVASLNPPLLNNGLVVLVINNLLNLDDDMFVGEILLNISTAIALLVTHSSLSPALLSSIVDYTLHQLSSEVPEVRQSFLSIVTMLPVDSFQRLRSQDLMKKHTQALARRRGIMSGVYGSLSVEQFRSVATLLFKQYTSSEEIDIEWLQRLIETADVQSASVSEHDRNPMANEIMHHTGLLEHWLLWQAADFCVAHRLRTPIGKPLDTFMCIEAAIKQIAADKRIEVSPKCGADTKRVWMLLQFMENLEKALYNAYEGTASQMTTHGKIVRSFFRTNRGTCIEWLTRIRLHILSVASAYGHPATVIRQGYELITDMVRSQSTQTPEFELVLVYLTEAWCQLNCSEAIQGLYEWCKVTCNRKLSWIKPFFLKATGRYESASKELKATLDQLLSPQSIGGNDSSIKLQTRPGPAVAAVNELCAQQITNCYTSLQSWDEASNWLQEFETKKAKQSGLAGVDPLQYCDKVMMVDSRVNSAAEIISWSKQQHLTDMWIKAIDSDDQLLLSEADSSHLEKLLMIECSSDWPASIQPNTSLTLHSQQMCESALRVSDLTHTHTHSLPWLLKLSQITQSEHVSIEYNQSVMVACCREARKTENLTLAQELMKQLALSQSTDDTSPLNLRIARESAKQVYCTKGKDLAIEKMVSVALAEGGSGRMMDRETKALVARSTLTAVKWLQSESEHLQSLTDNVEIVSIPSLSKLISDSQLYISDSTTVPLSDKILGAMMQRSTIQCSSLAKTWYNFGNWAYKWGRKCLDNAEQSLSSEEIETVQSYLPTDLTRQETDDILGVMSMVQGTFIPADEDLADDSPDYGDDDLLEIRRRLISCCPTLTDQSLDNLLDFWRTTAKRVYTLYEESAKSYFSYLNLTSTNQGSDHHNVTVTLRLLRLLVKHAWELRDVLEEGLAQTPTAPWRSIIPQLFSRLNHPEHYVRQSVSELLARLADDYPHLIVYPAIVGCNQSQQSQQQVGKTLTYMETGEAADVEADGPALLTTSDSGTDCFTSLVDTLSSNNPLLIQQVRTLVNELCRITVLWDEFWLGSLGQLNATAAERIKALASEVERVKNNSSLSASERKLLIREKRETIVKPLIHTIERLSDITGQTAETRHEQWFQESYSHLINKGLQKLRNPERDEDLLSDWQPFKRLQQELYQRSQKRSSNILKMKDLSSVLASLSDTVIPLPGAIAKSDKQPITLQSVHATVQILPTKTKPKKLAFLGSDGQKYTYLFKGLEDLHLDERIMQLLNIVNDMLVSKGLTDSECALYRARNYSVTPLGLRSGLIQWVDGCVPLFALYKRWQVREAAAQAKPNGGNNTVLRPSEVFYSKLLPLLKPLLEDKGLNPKEVKISEIEKIRKEWPLSDLVTATKQLIADTPSHLVAKEIWCHSTSSNEWWDMTQTYCRSVAVMSAIGYILGLGDRHLDNLLLDLNNGEMVHIDYNVCFDKGKSLRVPERVPFRLTSNVVAALGATGVEGIFRSACEHTIKSMRLGKETLLTLLEAFVYDPLVDWTVGGETGLAGAFYGGNYAFGNAAKDYRRRKRQMERDITRSMFSIRVTEMRAAWLQNKEEMTSSLAELVRKLKSYVDETDKIISYTEQISQCREILKYIEELKKEGGQAIAQLTLRHASHQKLISAGEDCRSEVKSLDEELTKYSNLHQAALEAVCNGSLEKLELTIKSIPMLGKAPSSFTRPFMQSVGQMSLLDQLEQQHEQLILLVERRQSLMIQCKESLIRYGAITSLFPAEIYISNHIMGDCRQLTTVLNQNFSYERCVQVVSALEANKRNSPAGAAVSKAVEIERALHTSLAADTARLERYMDRSESGDLSGDITLLIGAYEAKKQSVTNYQQLHGENGHRTILFVVVPKLVETTKRYLTMESTASKSEKRLHSLTFRDGDWFLDELSGVTENLLEYVNLCQTKSHPADVQDHGDEGGTALYAPALKEVINGVQKVYSSLQDMLINFQQIILPDILTSLVKGEPSVQGVVDSFNDDVIRSTDLSKLCSKLETTLRNIIFGTKDIDSQVSDAVSSLRAGYARLLSADADSSHMTKGRMLSLAFSGLFDLVYAEYCAAMRCVSEVNTPKSWRKIDVIREAGALQLTQFNGKTEKILADLFFVKQMIAMREFYSVAESYVNTFTGSDHGSIDSYDLLSRSVKSFIADFVRKQVLGVASHAAGLLVCENLMEIGLDVDKEIALKDFGATSKVSIDDLCKKGLDRRTQTGTQLSQANSIISSFESAWRKQEAAKRLTRNKLQLQSLVSQQQRYLLCYQWLHEDLLSTSGQSSQGQSTRKEVLTELHKNLSALMSTNAAYNELVEKQTSSESTIAQRLKWAAGANPKLHSVLSMFSAAQATRSTVFQTESAIVKDLNTYCHSLLHLETMRTKSNESSLLEAKCRQLFNRCLEVCKSMEEDEQLSDLQKLMISLMSKSDRQKTGNAFLGRAHDAVQSHLSSMNTKIKSVRKSVVQIEDKYQAHVSSIQYGTLNAHHKLISEVRAVLKTLAKEEVEDSECGGGSLIQDYLRDYKLFSEKLTNLLKIAAQDKITETLRDKVTELVEDVEQDIDGIFMNLFDISKPISTSVEGKKREDDSTEGEPDTDAAPDKTGASAPGAENVTTAAGAPVSLSTSSTAVTAGARDEPSDKVQRDPKTGKAVQERNSYAVSVWRRVKMKLDGRELDPNKKMSVTDQVGYIITEATDIKNLAQMYEGWTSWV